MRNLTLLLGYGLLGVISAGCLSVGGLASRSVDPAWDLGQAGPPLFAVRYYPYAESFERDTGQPHPNYSAWTDKRMKKDIERLADVGIGLVLLEVDPTLPNTQLRLARYRRFLELCATNDSNLKVMLHADCGNLTAAEADAFVNWCASLVLYAQPASYKFGSSPVIRVTNLVNTRGLRKIGLRPYPTAWQEPPGFRRLSGLSKSRLDRGWQAIEVRTGLSVMNARGKRRWTEKRRDGKGLARSINGALAAHPAIVVVQSWNNYRDGSFAEPNTLDGSRVCERLQGTIASTRPTPTSVEVEPAKAPSPTAVSSP